MGRRRLLRSIRRFLDSFAGGDEPLQPADYGSVGIVIFFSSCRTVQDAGLTSAIGQKLDLRHKAVSSAFWFFMGVGMPLTLTAFSAAPGSPNGNISRE